MSSRIVRRDDLDKDDAQPIQWRHQGQARGQVAALPAGAKTQGSGNSDSPPVDAERVKQLTAQAYQQGLAAGEAVGAQKAQARLEPVLASFTNMVAELTGSQKKLRAEAEEAAVALAIQVARRVLHREIEADPEALLGLVKAAFQKCDARATQGLRVSPQDADAIRENQARLHLPPGLEIMADRSLPRGSAIFETSRGDLDGSVDTQLMEIERGFADVLKRRNS